MNQPVDRYELLGELATGGMATVYLGRQTGPFGFKRTVAIKSMHPHIAKDEDFRAMFLDEATLTARIRHPNVVPTLDIVVAETKVLLVMEYIDGVSLSFLERLLKKDNGASAMFPPAIAVAIVLDALHGLHAAHELVDDADGKPLNVVHRDVSPQNIHVGVDGLTRVLDFGIAKATTRRYVTQAGEVKGKLSYMASEQVSGGEVDRRTDIFAAGVVLWELLCGRRLFDGQNDADIIRLVIEGKAEPPSFLTDEELPPALDKVVLKAIALKKEDRYNTADEMARALAAALPPAPRADVTAFVRKHAASELDARSRRFRQPTVITADVAAEPEAKAVLTVLMEHATYTALSTSRHPSGAVASIPPPSSIAPPPMGAETSSKTLPRVLLAAATLVVILALTGGAFLVGSRSATTRNANAANASPPMETTSATAASSSAPPATASASASASASPETASATPPRKTPAIPPKKPPVVIPHTTKPTAAPRKDCSPPFTVDAHGDRHYKPECVE